MYILLSLFAVPLLFQVGRLPVLKYSCRIAPGVHTCLEFTRYAHARFNNHIMYILTVTARRQNDVAFELIRSKNVRQFVFFFVVYNIIIYKIIKQYCTHILAVINS